MSEDGSGGWEDKAADMMEEAAEGGASDSADANGGSFDLATKAKDLLTREVDEIDADGLEDLGLGPHHQRFVRAGATVLPHGEKVVNSIAAGGGGGDGDGTPTVARDLLVGAIQAFQIRRKKAQGQGGQDGAGGGGRADAWEGQ